jgi:hypothetical protein
MMKKATTAVSIRTTSDSSSEQVLLGQGKKQSVFKKVVQGMTKPCHLAANFQTLTMDSHQGHRASGASDTNAHEPQIDAKDGLVASLCWTCPANAISRSFGQDS